MTNQFLKRLILAMGIFFLILAPGLASSQIFIASTDASCNSSNGTALITVVSSGGFNFEYAVDGIFQNSNFFDNLSSGGHEAIVRDKNTKCFFSKSFTIKDTNALTVGISGTGTIPYCDSREPQIAILTASASGGSGNYEYSWPGQTITVRASGKFEVTVTDKQTGCSKIAEGEVIFIPVRCARDPNDITGPAGYGPRKMIAKSEEHAYTIHFENDPAFATAPAQVVKIRQHIDTNVNIFSLRLGDFGFGGSIFSVPENSTFYNARLDLNATLGISVDATAGIDAVTRDIFWIFESKDASTGLPPANGSLGFLPVNDSSSKGEGFVGYTVKAANPTKTGDSIRAKANIIFDVNAPIPTPEIVNIIDAVAPTSKINLATVSRDTISLFWSGTDDAGGSGVKDYALYVSQDEGPFIFYRRFTGLTTNFIAAPGSTYCFFTMSRDNVDNQEAPLKNKCEVSVSSGGPLPLTWLYFRGQEKTDDVELTWATGSEINTAYFIVERSLNGRDFEQIGKVNAAGNNSLARTYEYLDLNALKLNAQILYYRLRQVDLDGKFTYSNVIVIAIRKDNEQMVKVYPNPFSQNITLLISTINRGETKDEVKLYSVNGQLLYSRNLSNRQNNIPIELNDLPALTPGTYLLQTNLNGKTSSIKLVKY